MLSVFDTRGLPRVGPRMFGLVIVSQNLFPSVVSVVTEL